ncbi:symmetrical bis(5'-nucleosyl)-tetraphosphatase [Brackiella oedipodis]|uniref:symmetrical bis(5'-nucleosyl)-tetraphosphatase n=1 Tax=Brackiella oedipodis TaxID=124225 RepID=UPI00056EFFC1|nr:symmetrical bis(5'-nucleosyl)-tetraphosphatase [Brackiella oedipodis]
MSDNKLNHKTSPNIWAVGDIQGCGDTLERLLAEPAIKKDKTAQIWFAGDLVNRGPSSAKVLDLIMQLGDRARCVLGNHDLHLLGAYAGVRELSKSDTIQDILQHKQAKHYIDWLRKQPLAHYDYQHLMVHAGVINHWDVEKCLKMANKVSKVLRADDWQDHMAELFGNEPSFWQPGMGKKAKRRFAVNVLTRMRMCEPNGRLNFSLKNAPSKYDKETVRPWFDLADRKTANTTIIFGHWSTLGLYIHKHLLGLDTGCVWGGTLTAIRLNDRTLVQIPNREKRL